MIYNSNGNNAPYQSGGNAKVNKQLRELQESVDNVTGRLNGYVGTDESEINGMIGDALDDIRDDVEGTETALANLDVRTGNLEQEVGGFHDEVRTAKVQAQDADFHKVVAGKYVFQNGTAITGTDICKINDGSVVYATDGTNSILIDYTNKDAWVAKAKVADGEHFDIYSNGVLTFTQSGGWSVYVIGNDFDLAESVPSEAPVEVVTGVTIGGTLYAALARDYTFDSITVTSATIDSATVDVLNATNARLDAITSNNVITQDAVISNAGIDVLGNSKRNFDGYVDVATDATNITKYIKMRKFTGTYNVKLVKNVNGAMETLFTATVTWNGKYPIVQYYENQTLLDRDYLYQLTLTDHGLYFVTQGDGRLFYGWDSFDAVAPESGTGIDGNETLIAEYVTQFPERTVFFGDHSSTSGVDVLGEMNADWIKLPEGFSIDNLSVHESFESTGSTTLADTTVNGVITQDGNFTTTGNVSAEGSGTFGGDGSFGGDFTVGGDITADGKLEADKLYGKELGINDTGDSNPNTSYVHADANGVEVNVDTDIDGELTVSEKGAVGELQPEILPGVDSNYFELDGSTIEVDSQGNVSTVTPEGVKISSTKIADEVRIDNGVMYRKLPLEFDSAGYLWNNIFLTNDSTTTGGFVEGKKTDFISYSDIYDKAYYSGSPATSGLQENTMYFLFGGSWSKSNAYGGAESVTSSENLTLASMPSSDFHPAQWLNYRYYPYKYAKYSQQFGISWYSDTGITSENDPRYTATYYPLNKVTYRVYQSDPSHTYDANDQVLSVNGNENVTRDLKVQGYIFMDEAHIAFLPEIKSKVIEVGDLD